MSESGRQLGCGMVTSTSFPLVLAIQRAKPALSTLSAAVGTITTSAVTPPAGVAALHACIVASSTRRRGDSSVSPLAPRVQSRQVPYFSFFASMPHAV